MALAVEFAVRSPGSCPVARASERADAPVTDVSRASVGGDDPITEEFALPAGASVAGKADPESVAGGGDPGSVARGNLEPVATAGGETRYRFERDPAADCVCAVVERIAGPATDVRAADGTLVVTAHVEDREAVRAVVARLRETFDGVRVRRLTPLDGPSDEAASPPPDRLTDRQREVVRTAHEMGYFEYPRDANAGEVADELGISRSTFAEHLAAATGKLFESALDPDGAFAPPATRP